MRGVVKELPEFLTLMIWCTMNSYRLDRVLQVISEGKILRGCEMQFGGSGATSGMGSGFCISITYRATHSNSSPRKSFLSSSDHRILRISLRVTLAVHYYENGPQGGTFRNNGGHQIKFDDRMPEDSKRILLLVLPTMAESMEQVCVCV
jgi:hypothetical protein